MMYYKSEGSVLKPIRPMEELEKLELQIEKLKIENVYLRSILNLRNVNVVIIRSEYHE
jgi:hypothetical protein